MKINHVIKIVSFYAVIILTSSCSTITNYRIEWPDQRVAALPHKIALSHDGKLLAVGGLNQGLYLYNTKTRATLHSFVDQTDPETTKAYQHLRGIYALDFTPDGQLLISGDEASQLKIWSTQSGELIKKINTKSGRINALAISRNGKQIATGSELGLIKIWDIKSGRLLTEIRPKLNQWGLRYAILDLVYLHEADQLVAIGAGINIWDVQSGKKLKDISWHYKYGSTRNLSLSNDGRYLANSMVVWDLQNDRIKFIARDEKEKPPRNRISTFSRDGKFFITSSKHGKINIWDVNSGKIVESWLYDKKIMHVSELLLAPDNKTLITLRGGGQKSIYFWDIITGEEIFPSHIPEIQPKKLIKPYSGGAPTAISNDRKLIANGGTLVDSDSLKIIATIPLTSKQRSNIRSNAISPDKQYYAACIKSRWDDGFTGIWDISSKKLITQLNHFEAKDLVFSLDGKSFIFIDLEEVAVYRFNSQTGKIIWKIQDYEVVPGFRLESEKITHLRLSNSGHEIILVITKSNGTSYISVRNFMNGKQVRVLKNKNLKYVDAVTLSNDDNMVALATRINNDDNLPVLGKFRKNLSILIGLDIHDGRQLFKINDARDKTTALAFSPDHSDLATGGLEQTVHIWNLKSLKNEKEFRYFWEKAGLSYTKSLHYSPDGKFLHIGGGIWDLVNSKYLDVTSIRNKLSTVE